MYCPSPIIYCLPPLIDCSSHLLTTPHWLSIPLIDCRYLLIYCLSGPSDIMSGPSDIMSGPSDIMSGHAVILSSPPNILSALPNILSVSSCILAVPHLYTLSLISVSLIIPPSLFTYCIVPYIVRAVIAKKKLGHLTPHKDNTWGGFAPPKY